MQDEKTSGEPELANSTFDVRMTVDQGSIAPSKLDDKQRATLTQLRSKITDDPDITTQQKAWCDDPCLTRYLRARNWDLAKVSPL